MSSTLAIFSNFQLTDRQSSGTRRGPAVYQNSTEPDVDPLYTIPALYQIQATRHVLLQLSSYQAQTIYRVQTGLYHRIKHCLKKGVKGGKWKINYA